jgi:endonuclease/exonuclease/phosphatase family metal-dependent hydrolase
MQTPVKEVPPRTQDNLIVASYNVQWLGQLEHDMKKLARVIQHFDLCGLIEIKAEEVLSQLVGELKNETNQDWGYVHGVRTKRPQGVYYEAFGFVWRRDRVQLGDGLVSNIWDNEEKFRNDPFVAAFRRGNFDFVMALLHTRWSKDPEGSREEELKAVVDQITWMKTFITENDLLLSGDFNYSGTAAEMADMARRANLVQLDNNAPSTIKPDGTGFASSYDHIYVGDQGKDTMGRRIGDCTTLDVCQLLFGNNDSANMKLVHAELSDHLPIFATFDVR